MILNALHDAMGHAIADYEMYGRTRQKLLVHSSLFDDDEMPLPTLFRDESLMPDIERTALRECKGNVLDVGAGAGCHSLALQRRKHKVTAIDVSPLSVEACKRRGVLDARCADFYDTSSLNEQFHTILLLMNGIGIAGTLAGVPRLLQRCGELLAEGGQVLADSTDIAYCFKEDDGTFCPPVHTPYYGEIDFQMSYGNIRGETFNWVYVDPDTLQNVAYKCGWTCEVLQRGTNCEYLCRLTRK